MKIDFCGFNEKTTVKEIRDRYLDGNVCLELKEYRKRPRLGAFDALFAILLGGTSNTDQTRLNYIKTVYNKNKNDGSTWEQNALVHTTGRINGNKELMTFINSVDPSDTLDTVYNKINNWSKIKPNEKQVLLEMLEGKNNQMQTANNILSVRKIEELVKKNIDENKQVIFTGAPGTGKTWAVRDYVGKKTNYDKDRYRFVQFHSSYDYTDFVEGLRPVPNVKGENIFVRMDGIFKEFCRDIVERNLKMLNISTISGYKEAMDSDRRNEIVNKLNETPYYFVIDEINRADLSKVFGELMFGLEESYRGINNRFDTQYKNLNTYHMVKKNVAGIEKNVAEEIDEDCFEEGFFVPENLIIIGTMNDIDRSVESFDFALRRRFVWIDIKANDVMEESLKSMRTAVGNSNLSDQTIKDIASRIIDMNDGISNTQMGLTEAYHIGPAYFKELVRVGDADVEEELVRVFANRIEPILREYTRGRKNGVKELIEGAKEDLGI